MDNLVTVFKSMEVAAGFNIFTTQAALSTKSSEDGLTSGKDEKSGTRKESIIAHQSSLKRKESNNKLKQKNERAINTTNQCPEMPSFPSKKRVHVTPYPISETPLRPEKMSKLRSTCIALEANKDDTKADADKDQDSLLPPFFWLREENVDDDSLEYLSAQSTQDFQPYNASGSSDIKDSDDDESPIKMAPRSNANINEVFDSEMFEWTQRACSPELCLTPLNKKTAGRFKPIHDVDCCEVPKSEIRLSNDVSDSKSMKSAKNARAAGNDKTRRNICGENGTLKRRSDRHSQAKYSETIINMSSGNSFHEISEVLVKSRAVNNSNQENEDPKHLVSPREGNGTRKNNNNNGVFKAEAPKEDICAVLPLLTVSETVSNAIDKRNNTRIRSKKSTCQPKRKHMNNKVLEEVPDDNLNKANAQNQEYQKVITGPQVLSSKKTENGKGCRSNTDICGEELPKKKIGELRRKEKGKHNTDTMLDDNVNKVSLASAETGGCQNIQTSNLIDSSRLVTERLSQTKHFGYNNGENILRKCGYLQSKIRCAFCWSFYDTKDTDVFFEDDLAVNLATELARSKRIKCSCCGIRGAALGCYDKRCRKSFHYTCAKLVPDCRWDSENFVMLCPLHLSTKLPKEVSQSEKQRKRRSRAREEQQVTFTSKTIQDMGQMWTWPSGSSYIWVLCCSALTAMEKEIVYEFTRLTNVSISKTWSPAVTHVIASTDANGACRRTLKYLMGILEGKWILSIEWIKACRQATGPVEEEKFEITVDVHGFRGGPQRGRMRAINKEPKLFSNLKFYMSGEFIPAYKGYLQELITSAGGTVLQRKPITRNQGMSIDSSPMTAIIVIYSLEAPEKQKCNTSNVAFEFRKAEAEALADACGAKVATNLWIIDSIAASNLQPLAC